MKAHIITLFIIALIYGNMHLKAQRNVMQVWPNKIPGVIENTRYKEDTSFINNSPRINKVTNPTLTIYPAPKDKACGTAVVICPGGGYGRLAIDHEGYAVAEWMNNIGITAILLKYRLPSDSIMKDKNIGPLQDVQEAIRIVRRNSKEWGIKPNQIGIMGFSAGGHLASTASTHFQDKVYDAKDTVSARPDFSLLIYPVISMEQGVTHGGSRQNLLGKTPSEELVKKFSNELQVTQETPPAFLVHATDDKAVPVQNSINYYLALKKNNIPAELHLYEKGGHGFGLGKSTGTESTWPEACRKWLITRGLL